MSKGKLKIRGSKRSIDLFSGAGGLTEGFHQAGFSPLAATDFDEVAAETFKLNFPEAKFVCRSVAEVSAGDLLGDAGVTRGEVDVLLGGPPCQAFSVYNHQRGFHDERSELFREYLRLVQDIYPKTVVIENVTGMSSLDNGRAVREICSHLNKLGYEVDCRVLRAEEFGVPQERRRLVFLASRVGPVIWPTQTHPFAKDYVNVAAAIGDLPALAMGEGSDDRRDYRVAPASRFQEAMRKSSDGVYNHFAPKLTEINSKRMTFIPQGGSWRDIPTDLLPAGMQKAKRSDHTKRYGRLSPHGLFSTILTKADLHWGAYIHPDQDRTLTVRECARAQSFPDSFRFLGSRVDQYKQVGNAVPPLLARAVAKAVLLMLDSSAQTELGTHAEAC